MQPPTDPVEAETHLAELRAKLEAAELAMAHNEVAIRRLEHLAESSVAPRALVADASTFTGEDAGGVKLTQHVQLMHLEAVINRERIDTRDVRDAYLEKVTALTHEGMDLLAAAGEPLAVLAAPGREALNIAAVEEAERKEYEEDDAAAAEVQPLPAHALLED
jgi:hypothetical protein